ncbi:MAG: 30S ribosomal protein S12 methylthiotransferase RimO [Gemmatimonadetes bacterium]|nr:30S ribosomal protein S12 methylthiotransferase RimO [Gemmatimonadota bacterium]NNM05220.1 30S ribosomal protein S12 methylthiotransferase RimO [Gemmatimonadota bacterium]
MKRRDLPVIPLSAAPIRAEVDPTTPAVQHQVDPVGPENGPRIALVTLGCDKNTVDSEHMMAALVGQGARVTGEVSAAEVVIVNTCGFIEAAKEQSIETILEACELKESGDVKAVAAVGCMVQRYKDDLAREIPEVDLFLGLAELADLIPSLRARGLLPDAEDLVPTMERPLRVLATETPHTSFLKISEGCDHSCAFCAIPLMRGLHRSSPVPDLVQEARALGSQGVKELNIISQDTTWYGRDQRRHDPEADLLPELLKALLGETEIPWFRLFYMYPSGITRELVELLASEPRLLSYLDMPLQHGSDRILEAMRRPERRATILERVSWLREAIPDLTLRTTVIVGFPGEREEDFRELLDLLEEVRFDRVGAFSYSLEEGTAAAAMQDQIPEEEKAERLEALLDLQREISFELNLDQVGRRTIALVDRVVDDDPEFGFQARIETQALDVDGVTNLLPAEQVFPGDFVEIEVLDALDYDLIGAVRRKA